MLTSIEELCFETGRVLVQQLARAGIEVLKPAAFEPGNFTVEKASPRLGEIKRLGKRIVTLIARDKDKHTVASSAALESMTKNWGWIGLGPLERSLEVSAPPPSSMQGWLYFRPVFPSVDLKTFAEHVSYHSKSNVGFDISAESVDLTSNVPLYNAYNAYNAAMLYARAVTSVMSEGGNFYDGSEVTAAMRNMTFAGVGDSAVTLDPVTGDLSESYEVMNYVFKAQGGMGSMPVGVFNRSSSSYFAYKREVVWPGNITVEVPVDHLPGSFFFSAYCIIPLLAFLRVLQC